MRRALKILSRTLCGSVVAVLLALPAGASAVPGQLTVTLTPGKWCAPVPDGAFVVSGNDAPAFSFRCSGAFIVKGDPLGAACCNDYVDALVDAPSGLTITGAQAVGSVENLNDGSGWAGGSVFGGIDMPWQSGANTSFRDGPFSSSYWGVSVYCPAGSSCTGAGSVALTSVVLTASETTGPSLLAEGPYNLWNQNQPGEWIWNPPGDPWSLMLAGWDPSGVCSMAAVINGRQLEGPSSVPDTSEWRQCPDPTWTPDGGAAVDTRDFLEGAGSIPLVVSATNAADLTTAYSDTLHVDDDPVTLSLGTADNVNPTVWVNQPVTVVSKATAGPSGLGGTSCNVDSGTARWFPGGGMTVNGDGVHTVTCTAWNNAVGPQGQPDSTTSSLAVRIDEAPPTITFGPENPTDPTAVTVNATDSESGVAGGSVEIAPAGTSNWTDLSSSFDGARLLAHVDDAGLRGAYTVRATSCDNVGNCASATEPLSLPVRLASDSEVSLTRILTRACARLCSGEHRLTRSLQVPFGQPVTIHGLYTSGQGVPIPGQPVQILAAPNNHTGAFAPLTTVTTASNGTWTATVPSGPSRIIRATTDGTSTILPSSGQVSTVVPAEIRLLDVWPRHVAWGGTVHLVGQLVGGYLPPGGALVRLRIGYKSSYSTYGVEEHVTGSGRFSTVATFGPGDPSMLRTYWFQIASLPMGNYPYAPGASQRVPVIVGGHPG